MLIVKIMSDEDTADTDGRKGFMLHAGVIEAHFSRIGDGTDPDPKTHVRPWLTLRFSREGDDAISFEPRGNVYVMNERGTTVASYGVAPIIYADAPDPAGTDAYVRKLTARFLTWRLPDDFAPDDGISFKPTFNEHTDHPGRHQPTGTNLFSFAQAEAMLRHVLDLTDAKPSA